VGVVEAAVAAGLGIAAGVARLVLYVRQRRAERKRYEKETREGVKRVGGSD